MENLMQKYIALSKEFRETKSPESIGNLYSFLDELKSLEDDKQTLLILSQVYSLLAFHKSAYDIFVQIADKNNHKDAKKLFAMSEFAQSHGDNFIVKNKAQKKEILQEMKKMELSDLRFVESDDNWNNYEIDIPLIIFGKLLNKPPKPKLALYKNIALETCIDKISNYLKWLSDCKKMLIDFYNNEEYLDDTADDDWYNSLEIYELTITIGEKGKMFADVSCGDDFWSDHILDFEFYGKKIVSMNYDG